MLAVEATGVHLWGVFGLTSFFSLCVVVLRFVSYFTAPNLSFAAVVALAPLVNAVLARRPGECRPYP